MDEKGIAEKGHVFPWENWILTWEDATSAQALSSGIKITWQKKVQNTKVKDTKDISSNYNDFEKIGAEINAHLEKAKGLVAEERLPN